ncbi:MAG: hypothetical protein ABIA92_00850 [Patescibacteria group bacterium]
MSLRLIITGVLLGILVSFTSSEMAFACAHPDGICPEGVSKEQCEIEGCIYFNRHHVEQKQNAVPLIEPIAGDANVPVAVGGVLPFLVYVQRAWNWLVLVAVGLVTLWVLVSGGMIIVFGGDQSGRSKWIEHIKWAIIGLIALVFVGVILNFLNASFFV